MLSALRNDNSPFTQQQIELLQQGLNQIDATQAAWLSGYLAGQLAQTTGNPVALPNASLAYDPEAELKIYFGSQTGNGESIAETLGIGAQQRGVHCSVHSLADLRPAALNKVHHAVFIISTHGDGDPPDDALDLFEFLERPNAPGLEHLCFQVLALGDSTYAQFCEAGRKLEELLLARGAKTFAERVDVDLDYEEPVAEWSQQVLDYGAGLAPDAPSLPDAARPQNFLSVVPPATQWSRKNPFTASVQYVQKITGLESDKGVYHLELSLEDSGIEYQPGDSLGIWAHNAPELVDSVLSELGIDPLVTVENAGESIEIRELLRTGKELTRLSPGLIDSYAELCVDDALRSRFRELDDGGRQRFIEQRQFIDLVEEYPAQLDAEQLAGLLRPLAPRSYSIASSQLTVDEEVHLTVASVHSDAIGVQRSGVASSYLNQRLQAGDEVGVFLEPNKRFHLPEDPDAPLILVAAGTGIAPFRAFLQQLEEQGSQRDVWLIFGNRRLRADFLYQREWLAWRSSGLLTRIDCAFSRDQEEKRYVQHLIDEQYQDIGDWLDRGAHVYVCGALTMGHEVESALTSVLSRHGGVDESVAIEQLTELRRSRRLAKDLY